MPRGQAGNDAGRAGSVTAAVHCSGSIRPCTSAARPSRAGVEMCASRATLASSATESTASAAWPIERPMSAAGTPWASSSPARRLCDDLDDDRADQIARARQPRERLRTPAARLRQRVDLGEHLARGRAGDVGSRARRGAGGQHRHVGGRARELDAGHVAGHRHVQPGSRAACRRAGARSARSTEASTIEAPCSSTSAAARGTAQHGNSAGAAALCDERRRQRAERRHQALGQHEQRRTAARSVRRARRAPRAAPSPAPPGRRGRRLDSSSSAARITWIDSGSSTPGR